MKLLSFFHNVIYNSKYRGDILVNTSKLIKLYILGQCLHCSVLIFKLKIFKKMPEHSENPMLCGTAGILLLTNVVSYHKRTELPIQSITPVTHISNY